ncbi:molybdenum cofactor guanylyltransferase [Halobiforma nitratireducens]|uniref:Probable molybdenum cofactor guanylyltransferase n=1 Tax=Halobiforma nitratireducens JCM 10879 TaxID=1227454 RepID=M0LFY6_9EURY|nr:molybdenum cofactor guanylyltransferase [Halobiforma nitratireducens]EMA31364.1 molybdopterin-guanine dinucleotide biosynthesis protein A [Halobiforma nitratireducens JCM 10879]
MSTEQPLAGVVIAGGYSTRFGDEDKAIADLAGTPMIRRVVDRLAGVADELVVNCRDDQLEAVRTALEDCNREFESGPRFATDPVEDRGPLAGIRVGFDAATREYGAVVACDMPFVDPALLELLAERAHGRDGALVRLADGWFQPTQAVYRTDPMADACADALAESDGRVLAATERLDCVTVLESELEAAGIDPVTFESVDTREQLETATKRLS